MRGATFWQVANQRTSQLALVTVDIGSPNLLIFIRQSASSIESINLNIFATFIHFRRRTVRTRSAPSLELFCFCQKIYSPPFYDDCPFRPMKYPPEYGRWPRHLSRQKIDLLPSLCRSSSSFFKEEKSIRVRFFFQLWCLFQFSWKIRQTHPSDRIYQEENGVVLFIE